MVEGWAGAVTASVFVLATLLCAVSLVAHGPGHGRRLVAAEANHVLMGVGMVLMAAPLTMDVVPPVAGVVVFGAAAAGWLVVLGAVRLRGGTLGSIIGGDRCTGHPVHLLLLDAAMVLMYLTMFPVPAAPTAPGGGVPMTGTGHASHGAPSGEVGAALAGHAHGGSASPVLVGLSLLLAGYLLAHAVETTVVVIRRARAAAGVPVPDVGPVSTNGVATAAPVLAGPLAVLAHGPVQLLGQAGMGGAMAAMLLVGVLG